MPEPLWTPGESRIQNTNLFRFMNKANQKYGTDFSDYAARHEWSISHPADLWETLWDELDIIAFWCRHAPLARHAGVS